MVDFLEDVVPSPEGPCRKILNREEDFIREMVAETERTGRERVANIVEIEGRMDHTEPLEGDETSINNKLTAESMMDGLKKLTEIKQTPGRSVPASAKRYEVHTHPNGFAGLSPRDMETFAKNIYGDGSHSDGTLTATMTEEGIVLGGAYIAGEITEDDEAMLQREVSIATQDRFDMIDPRSNAGDAIADALSKAGIKFCTVVFPKQR